MGKQVTRSEMPNTSHIFDPETLGKLVKAKRTAMKMRQADCASLCGVGVNTLFRIESGNPNSTLGATFSVLRGLGIKLTTSEKLSSLSSDEGWV